MGKESKIAWTDATFNPFWGCEKVSEGCKNCYAEKLDHRMYPNKSHWGKRPHRFFGEKHWSEVEAWDNKARKEGKKIKVFCGSMCDIFQDSLNIKDERKRLFNLIEDTDHLTWLLLTKRPENVLPMLPYEWRHQEAPDNIWLGVTVENQDQMIRVRRAAQLREIFSGIFVSAEPLLGPVSIKGWTHVIDWVIIGGESGVNCRPMDINWLDSLVSECKINHVPVFVKQLGGYPDKRDAEASLMEREFPLF